MYLYHSKQGKRGVKRSPRGERPSTYVCTAEVLPDEYPSKRVPANFEGGDPGYSRVFTVVSGGYPNNIARVPRTLFINKFNLLRDSYPTSPLYRAPNPSPYSLQVVCPPKRVSSSQGFNRVVVTQRYRGFGITLPQLINDIHLDYPYTPLKQTAPRYKAIVVQQVDTYVFVDSKHRRVRRAA